jgi:hypothetical protein
MSDHGLAPSLPTEHLAGNNDPLVFAHKAHQAASGSKGQQKLTQSPSIVLKYLRSLSRITGVITDPVVLAQHDAASVPAGLGSAANLYLDAHGYDATAKLEISHAYREFHDVDDFCGYLCQKGMSKAEASWLFGFIVFSNSD